MIYLKKFTIILLSLILLLVGCNGAPKTSESNAASEQENTIEVQNLTELTGPLESKYIENNIKYIIIEKDNLSEKLDASELNNFESLNDGQILTVTYDENKKVVELLKVEEPPKVVENSAVSSPTPNSRIVSYTETISFEGLNEYKNANLEYFSQYGIEKVTTYTDAESDGQGGFYWDDGNRFVLIAHKETGGYVLFDERIQVGNVRVNVYSIEDVLNISLMEYGTANISFRVFKLVDGEFIESIKYQGEGNVNMIDSF